MISENLENCLILLDNLEGISEAKQQETGSLIFDELIECFKTLLEITEPQIDETLSKICIIISFVITAQRKVNIFEVRESIKGLISEAIKTAEQYEY